MTRLITTLLVLLYSTLLAHANPRSMPSGGGCNAPVCADAPTAAPALSTRAARALARGEALERRLPLGTAMRPPETARSYLAAQILPHPTGCPRTLFCGCGTAQKLLGITVTAGTYAKASYWLRFPRATPGPGMAEVTRGGRHVRAIEADLGNGLFQFYDPNSGKGLTRRHVGRIVGVVVRPG